MKKDKVITKGHSYHCGQLRDEEKRDEEHCAVLEFFQLQNTAWHRVGGSVIAE